MPVKWNIESELKLAMAIMKASNTKPKHWENVATMMGDTYTGEGVRQHFQKMLKSITFADTPALASTSASTLTATTTTTATTTATTSAKGPNLHSSPGRKRSLTLTMKRKRSDVEEEEAGDEGKPFSVKKKKEEEDDD
ncbi:hypothetical protein MMC11_001142 [Xylographa trunciseda]|nr:hypothetical protein [Xylographa trunciseda]